MKYPDKRVMFLAPEIPALSATFVYNEMFAFQEAISPVVAVSVHKPHSPAGKDIYQKLDDQVLYLYEESLISVILSSIRMLFRKPRCFVRTFFALVSDIFSLGLVSRTAAGMVYRFFYAAFLAEKMLDCKIDHLHVHFAHVPGDLAMYASRMTGIPFSLVGHANDIYERGWLLKQKAQRSAFFATISEFNKRALVEQGCPEDKIKIIRCGIDQEKFKYRGENTEVGTEFRVGSLGRLVHKKGFHTLIDSCAMLKQQSVPFTLEIAGDGPLAQQLEAQVSSLGLEQDIKFLGAMHHSEVSKWMKSLDLFALACCQDENGDVDGIPVVLMEAMAIGVPIITTRISGLPELVIHEETGLLGTPEDSGGISSLIADLAANKEKCMRLTAQAKSHVDSEFTLQSNVEKLGNLIFPQES